MFLSSNVSILKTHGNVSKELFIKKNLVEGVGNFHLLEIWCIIILNNMNFTVKRL